MAAILPVAIPNWPQIRDTLSTGRILTYETATKGVPKLPAAFALYRWNAEISSAFLTPLHLCEVVIRNAVAEAVGLIYGPNWPANVSFRNSLPKRLKFELVKCWNKYQATGQVVANTKFYFWETLLTARFDAAIWNATLPGMFPNYTGAGGLGASVAAKRSAIYGHLNLLRRLRNRIAHHEPIFTRNLALDFQRVGELVSWRCLGTHAWMMNMQQVIPLLMVKPP